MTISDSQYEQLARQLSQHPGQWIPWPETFTSLQEADATFEQLRDGMIETFKVDSAAFDWQRDDFNTIIDPEGRLHMEVTCAW